MYRRCFSNPRQWSYKEDNPESTPLSQISRSFSFTQIKTLNYNLGQGSFSVNSEAHSVTILRFVHNEWHRRRPSKSKDGDGSV